MTERGPVNGLIVFVLLAAMISAYMYVERAVAKDYEVRRRRFFSERHQGLMELERQLAAGRARAAAQQQNAAIAQTTAPQHNPGRRRLLPLN
jgi:hypothetical protein